MIPTPSQPTSGTPSPTAQIYRLVDTLIQCDAHEPQHGAQGWVLECRFFDRRQNVKRTVAFEADAQTLLAMADRIQNSVGPSFEGEVRGRLAQIEKNLTS